LIDYMGFRLIAISILPVDSSTWITISGNKLTLRLATLRYGSADAGATIHTADETLNGLMKAAAEKMNIKVFFLKIIFDCLCTYPFMRIGPQGGW